MSVFHTDKKHKLFSLHIFLLFLKKSGKLAGIRNNSADTNVGGAESVTYLQNV